MLPTITIRVSRVDLPAGGPGDCTPGADTFVSITRAGADDFELVKLEESLRYRQHSPAGFSWGYEGSGPAQLAFAILQTAVGVEFAEQRYLDFKRDVISAIPMEQREWKATVDLQEWTASETEGRMGDCVVLDLGYRSDVISRLLGHELLPHIKETLGRIVIEIERLYEAEEDKTTADEAILVAAFRLFDLLPMTDLETERIMDEGA